MQQQQASKRQAGQNNSHNQQQESPSNGASQSKHSTLLPIAEPEQLPQSNDIVLYYCTGWPQAKLHCSVKAGQWHDRDFEQVAAALSNNAWDHVSLHKEARAGHSPVYSGGHSDDLHFLHSNPSIALHVILPRPAYRSTPQAESGVLQGCH